MNFTFSQKIGLLWYKTFDSSGHILSSLRSLSFSIRLLFYFFFTASFAILVIYLLTLFLSFARPPVVVGIVANAAGGVAVLFAAGIFFLETLLSLKDEAIKRAYEGGRGVKWSLSFFKLKLGWRIAVYISLWFWCGWFLRSRIWEYLSGAVGGSSATSAQGEEELLLLFLEVAARYDLYYTVLLLVIIFGVEIYIRKKVQA